MAARLTRRTLVIGGAVVTAGAVAMTRERFAMDSAGATLTVPPETEPLVNPPAPATATRARAAAATATAEPVTVPPLEHASVAQLRRALDLGGLSIEELVEWSIARVEAMDSGDAGLGAVIELNPDALEIARIRDQELADGNLRGALHGIPILVKDIFATADGMATAAGSRALVHNAPIRNAFILDQLRHAGAIVLGKTNMTEWSNFRGSVQTSGWSARGGQTRNPYQLDRTPLGSSSGSAVAVSAGYAPLALGVETDGSIICPASVNATVGFKPTVGLVSRSGVIPLSFTQDSPGPIGRSVADVAVLLSTIAGFDAEDPAFGPLGWASPAADRAPFPVQRVGATDYTQFLDPDGLRGARIGVARNVFYDPIASAMVEDTLPMLESAGAVLVDPANIPSVGELISGVSEYEVTITEFPYGLNQYLATYTPDGPMQSLADVVAWNEANAEDELRYIDQDVFYRALDVGTVWDEWYQRVVANNARLSRREGLDALMDAYELNALIAPTAGPPAAIYGGAGFTGACSQIPAIAGYPIITVPVGYADGLPVGMSFFGRAFDEGTLIRLAYAFERHFPIRRAPEYRGSQG